MAIDFYLKDNTEGPPPLSISAQDVYALGKAFEVLQQKTGIDIDPSSDGRIYPDHGRLLMVELQKESHPSAKQLYEYLRYAASKNLIVYVLGE